MSTPPWDQAPEPARQPAVRHARRPEPPPPREPETRPVREVARRLRRRFPSVPEADTVLLPADRKTRPAAGRPGQIKQNGHAAGRPVPAAARQPGTAARPAQPSTRRTWVSRGVLLVILAVQAILTVRMRNTAFADEALYLYAGHMELGHLLYGSALQGSYPAYFSGAPVLYPVLGALADGLGGLTAARAVSLVAMLATTGLLYSLTRRLVNERAALCAALIFSVTEPAIFLGNLATYDATSLCLLALAAWLVVRTAGSRWPAYLAAAPVMAAAAATRYGSLLYLPTVALLAALAAWPHRGGRAVLRPVLLTAGAGGMLAGALRLAGPVYLHGLELTSRQQPGTTPPAVLALDCLKWGALPFALALAGAVAYALRPQTEAGEQIAPAGGRWRRALLGVTLTGTALLAPAQAFRLHTEASLPRDLGFGLLLAVPLAGVGLARIVGDHFRRAQLGIAIWAAVMVVSMQQASNLFHAWPSSRAFVQDLRRHLRPGAHYLVEGDEVPIYYLQDYLDAQPRQFTSTFLISYRAGRGRVLTGTAGYLAAIRAGYFQVICYNGQITPALDRVISRALVADPGYRLAATVPYGTGRGSYTIWVKR